MGGGFIVNINEVGGEYSSLVYGISNTFGTLPGNFGYFHLILQIVVFNFFIK